MNATQVVIKQPVGIFPEEREKRLKREPMILDWGTGEAMYPSLKEKVVIDCWLETRNLAECARKVRALNVRSCAGSGVIKKWLARPHVSRVVVMKEKERAISLGYTREKWISDGVQYEMGLKEMSTKMGWFFWKELGKALGYYVEGEGGKVQLNQNFNFVQSDGKE